ncbi:hypothetical protein LCGC14_0223500 [marine sediment metagenome]|uniref:Uncharacterized protein n=1 Tax=marine sediment metagenome TaxID=412755 RepID=A0A0F9UTH4_9ZZZZ
MISTKEKGERFRGWVLGIINGIDTKMLKRMIIKNEIPILWEYELPKYLGFMKILITEYKDQIIEQLKFSVVMDYAKEYRPDLARIIIHPQGKKWMERFLRMIRFLIENSHLENFEIAAKYNERMHEIKAQRAKQKENVQLELVRQEQERLYYENAQKEQEHINKENERMTRLRIREELKEEFRLKREEKRNERRRPIEFAEENKPISEPESVELEEETVPLIEAEEVALEEETVSDPLDVDTTVDLKNKYDFL